MKSLLLDLTIAILVIAGYDGFAQINLEEKVKNKVRDRVDQRTDEAIDKGLDETEEGIKKAGKKKEKPESESGGEEGEEQESGADEGEEQESGGSGSGSTPSSSAAVPAPQQELKSYSKFDFIPGDQVVFFDDFSQDAIGDFPVNWNTNGTGEVVTLGSMEGRWLKLNSGSVYSPLLQNSFPDNYTLEFDAVLQQTEEYDPLFGVMLFESDNNLVEEGNGPGIAGVYIEFWRECVISNWGEGDFVEIGSGSSFAPQALYGKVSHFSVWVQKQRIRVYINETKVIDLPRAFPANHVYNRINFAFNSGLDQSTAGGEIFLADVRIAAGAPDLRSKLLTEGKLVTRGILFDVNSDVIRPESYGTLKEISKILSENADLKVKIIGHTDSDGNDASNLELSRKRAASVKNSLVKDFGIEASRMETDGKGESEPASPNTTSPGKANNRRVEFIRM